VDGKHDTTAQGELEQCIDLHRATTNNRIPSRSQYFRYKTTSARRHQRELVDGGDKIPRYIIEKGMSKELEEAKILS
jgi:hypothetical protein